MVSINLIPQAVQQTQRWQRHLTAWVVLILGALVFLTIPLGIGWIRQAEENRLSSKNDLLQSRLSTARTQLRTLEASAQDSLLCLERAKALRSKRAWSSIVAAVANRLPAGCWLTSVASDPSTAPPPSKPSTVTLANAKPEDKDAPPPAITIDAPRKLMLVGYATDPSEPLQFVTRLKQAGVFANVEMVTARREPILDASYIRFELVCEW